MKVLFGISNEETVKGIVKIYEEKYKEKIEYKMAYYQKNFSSEIATGDYDRAVLSEELEPMPTKSYAEADKLAKMIPNELHITIKKSLDQNKELRDLYEVDETVKKVLDIAMGLEGMPRQASTHACRNSYN